MVSKIHPNAQRDRQFNRLPSELEALRVRQSKIEHDYAEADILRLSAFIRNNPNPILVFNPDGRLLKPNPAAERLLRRLQIQATDLLPANHSQIVQACMAGKMPEYKVEVTTPTHIFALTYHPLRAFKLVYLYAIDVTEFRRAEEELLRIVSSTIALAKQAILRLQTFRKTLPSAAKPSKQTDALSEMFVAMDGCVFQADHRLGEWDLE